MRLSLCNANVCRHSPRVRWVTKNGARAEHAPKRRGTQRTTPARLPKGFCYALSARFGGLFAGEEGRAFGNAPARRIEALEPVQALRGHLVRAAEGVP